MLQSLLNMTRMYFSGSDFVRYKNYVHCHIWYQTTVRSFAVVLLQNLFRSLAQGC